MFKAKIKITYHDDWSIDLYNKFQCSIEFIYADSLEHKKVMDLARIEARQDLHDDIMEFLTGREKLVDVEVFESKEHSLYVKITTQMDFSSNTETFIRNNCFRLGSVYFIEGSEYWNVFSRGKENVGTLIKELKEDKKRNIELLSLKKYDLELEELTQKQMEVLVYLNDNGYFNVPKDITLEEAAKVLGTSAANVNKHLNRALSKVINSKLG